MPEREIEICRRLKQYREQFKYSQVAFAAELGIDSSKLGSLEHCRAPLRCEIAQKICSVFDINPGWLATGEGRVVAWMPFPSLKELNLSEGTLFSKAYDAFISVHIEQEKPQKSNHSNTGKSILSFGEPSDPKTRLMAEDWIVRSLKEWIVTVPDSFIDDFVNKIIDAGESLISAYPADSKETIEKRIKQIKLSGIWLNKRRIRLRNKIL